MGVKEFMTSLFSQCKVNKVTLVSVPCELHNEILQIVPQMQHCGLRVTIDKESFIQSIHIWSYPNEVNLEELNKLVTVIG